MVTTSARAGVVGLSQFVLVDVEQVEGADDAVDVAAWGARHRVGTDGEAATADRGPAVSERWRGRGSARAGRWWTLVRAAVPNSRPGASPRSRRRSPCRRGATSMIPRRRRRRARRRSDRKGSATPDTSEIVDQRVGQLHECSARNKQYSGHSGLPVTRRLRPSGRSLPVTLKHAGPGWPLPRLRRDCWRPGEVWMPLLSGQPWVAGGPTALWHSRHHGALSARGPTPFTSASIELCGGLSVGSSCVAMAAPYMWRPRSGRG